jgi:N,N'-diacetyllegionaminate synthase
MNFAKLPRTWIVAEIGVNHEGDEAVAADLIRKAKRCGADAVKFQTFEIETYVSTVQPERRERSARFQLPYEAFRRLAKVAAEVGLVFFSTPLGFRDVEFLAGFCPIIKISSGDLTFLPLIRRAAETGKPMIISTGLGTQAEIQAAVDTVAAVRPSVHKDGSVALLHCVASYPAPAEDANLRNIGWLRSTFGLPVGYSDHTLGTKACELAVAAGAMILEKHFTYRKEDQKFHDHLLSADPKDMTDLVTAVREAERYLGSPERHRTASEEKMVAHMRRSLAAAVDIPAGEPVRPEWLTYLRPAWGVGPERFDSLVGRRLVRKVPAGDLIRDEDLSPA